MVLGGGGEKSDWSLRSRGGEAPQPAKEKSSSFLLWSSFVFSGVSCGVLDVKCRIVSRALVVIDVVRLCIGDQSLERRLESLGTVFLPVSSIPRSWMRCLSCSEMCCP